MLTENKETVLGTRLTREIQEIVLKVASLQGLNSSEYLRRLVLDDLEKRSLISTRIESLKEVIRNGNP